MATRLFRACQLCALLAVRPPIYIQAACKFSSKTEKIKSIFLFFFCLGGALSSNCFVFLSFVALLLLFFAASAASPPLLLHRLFCFTAPLLLPCLCCSTASAASPPPLLRRLCCFTAFVAFAASAAASVASPPLSFRNVNG